MARFRAAGGPSHTRVVNLSLRIVHRYGQVTNSVLAQDSTLEARFGKNRTMEHHWQLQECAQR